MIKWRGGKIRIVAGNNNPGLNFFLADRCDLVPNLAELVWLFIEPTDGGGLPSADPHGNRVTLITSRGC